MEAMASPSLTWALTRMRAFLEAIESAGELSVAKLLLAASQVQTLT